MNKKNLFFILSFVCVSLHTMEQKEDPKKSGWFGWLKDATNAVTRTAANTAAHVYLGVKQNGVKEYHYETTVYGEEVIGKLPTIIQAHLIKQFVFFKEQQNLIKEQENRKSIFSLMPVSFGFLRCNDEEVKSIDEKILNLDQVTISGYDSELVKKVYFNSFYEPYELLGFTSPEETLTYCLASTDEYKITDVSKRECIRAYLNRESGTLPIFEQKVNEKNYTGDIEIVTYTVSLQKQNTRDILSFGINVPLDAREKYLGIGKIMEILKASKRDLLLIKHLFFGDKSFFTLLDPTFNEEAAKIKGEDNRLLLSFKFLRAALFNPKYIERVFQEDKKYDHNLQDWVDITRAFIVPNKDTFTIDCTAQNITLNLTIDTLPLPFVKHCIDGNNDTLYITPEESAALKGNLFN